MKGFLILAIISIILLFAVFLAACSNVITTDIAKNSNSAAVTNSATTDAPTANTAKAFSVEFKSEPAQIQAGQPTTLVFTVKDRQGALVKDLQVVHEKPMHVLVVSKDLAEFYHLHPEQQSADGSYRVSHTFPNGGEYKLYADLTPQASAQVVEQIDVRVAGKERAKTPLQADTKFEKTVDGLRVVMKPDAEIRAAKDVMLNFQAYDGASGKPATDLQNYLGELAHFVIISEDMKDFVHAHPMSKGEHNESSKTADHDSDEHKHSTMEGKMTKPSASDVAAHTAFPRAGLYKVWAQFQRGGKVITVPFVVKVAEGDKTAENKSDFPLDAIKVTVSSKGYEPSSIPVKKGQPVKLAFYRKDADNCGGEVIFAKQNITKKLPVGKTVLVELMPTDAGEISFACGMDMMRGKLVVSEN